MRSALDRAGSCKSALLQIAKRLWVAIELLVIEGGGLLEHISQGSGERIACSR